MSTQEKIKEITDKIVKEYKPEKIILFGSYAWGKPGPDSDVDLFVVKNTQEPSLKRIKSLDKLFSRREFPMDFLVYTPSELEQSINQNRNLFIEDVVRNGRVLFMKPDYIAPLLHKPAELIK
jgi:uncharacterized protein